jgi:hypothetical protein
MSTNIPSDLHDNVGDPEIGHYMQIHRLQQLVSELLIENEQLRMDLFATRDLFAKHQGNGAVVGLRRTRTDLTP